MRFSSHVPNRPTDVAAESIQSLPFGELFESVQISQLRVDDVARAEIVDSRYVASFNWLKSTKPSIAIPGAPPRWTPLDVPEKLREDSGQYFRDINSAHYADHPIEPAVRALLVQQPDLSFEDIDLFACGSTIGNLLRLAVGTEKTFRFVVELVGETVFFIRREKSPKETIKDIRGYGHTFPANYTTWGEGVQSSDTHQRIMRYNFAGFDCVVRYEGDGYLPIKAKGPKTAETEDWDLPDLERLAMRKAGTVIPQEAIFDLKTRSAWKKDDVLSGEIGRLWARQIPNFVLAYHQYGVFRDIRVRDVREEILKWEDTHQKQLRLLAAIIGKIVATVRNGEDNRLEVCCQKPGTLEIRQVGGEFSRALPDDLRRVWAGGAGSDSGSDTTEGVRLGEDDAADSDEEDFTACSVACGYCGKCKY